MPRKKSRPKNTQLKEYKDVYIIPVMGPTGAGKSHFINLLLGDNTVVEGHDLKSCTVALNPLEVPQETITLMLPSWKPKAGKRLVLVDTPGFDDTSADDSEILKSIAEWLADTYGIGAKLAGVIYLQDICLRRVTGATKRNFEVFDKLCGKDACASVVLGTTQWTKLHSTDVEVAEHRVAQLRDTFWSGMIDKGSHLMQVDDQSPWELVKTVLSKGADRRMRFRLQIQKELEELGKSLPETEAAKVLKVRIEESIKNLRNSGATKAEIRKLVRDAEKLREKGGIFHFFSRFF